MDHVRIKMKVMGGNGFTGPRTLETGFKHVLLITHSVHLSTNSLKKSLSFMQVYNVNICGEFIKNIHH